MCLSILGIYSADEYITFTCFRYAITVWYYDQEERKRAVKRFKG